MNLGPPVTERWGAILLGVTRSDGNGLFDLPDATPAPEPPKPYTVDTIQLGEDHVDVELGSVRDWFLRADPGGKAIAATLRESLDQVLDGPRTRRFRYSDLRKNRKRLTSVPLLRSIWLSASISLMESRWITSSLG